MSISVRSPGAWSIPKLQALRARGRGLISGDSSVRITQVALAVYLLPALVIVLAFGGALMLVCSVLALVEAQDRRPSGLSNCS
jgi:hypothetical protein